MYPKVLTLGQLLLFLIFSFSLHAQTLKFNTKDSLQNFEVDVRQSANHLELALKVNVVDVADYTDDVFSGPLNKAKFKQIKLADLPLATKAGVPQLPYYSILLEADENDFQVFQTITAESFVAGVKPLPAPMMPCRCGDEKPVWNLSAENYYFSDDSIVTWEAVGDFRGRKIVKVVVKPLQVSPNGLRVVHDVKLHFQGAKGIFNWRDVWRETQERNFLVVAKKEMFPALKNFLLEKERRGFEIHKVEVKNQSSVEIAKLINDIHQRSAIDYAVIVGSEEDVPTHYVETSADWNTPSDRPYFSFGGSRDRVPDVLYSRIVANTVSEVSFQLKKFKDYESQKYVDASGLGSSIVVASNEGQNPTDFEYAERMLSPLRDQLGWTPTFLFQGEAAATAQNIIGRLNLGVEWFDYIGHGEGDRWPSVTGEALTIEHFKNLRSEIVKPIVIDVACQNGRMSRDGRIGVELMNQKKAGLPTGAVAYYGGSVDITWHPPAAMAVHISQSRSERRWEHLGEVIFDGQMRLLETFDDIVSASENLDWYHLQGDPAMILQD